MSLMTSDLDTFSRTPDYIKGLPVELLIILSFTGFVCIGRMSLYKNRKYNFNNRMTLQYKNRKEPSSEKFYVKFSQSSRPYFILFQPLPSKRKIDVINASTTLNMYPAVAPRNKWPSVGSQSKRIAMKLMACN